MDHLEEKLAHFPPDAVSVHAVFEENGTHALYRTSVTCHVPQHVVAAHEENREAGATIRRAFKEVERQRISYPATASAQRVIPSARPSQQTVLR